MNTRVGVVGVIVLLLAGSAGVHAADGLSLPAADAVWPQWQARVSLQTGGISPLSLSRQFDPGNVQRGLHGGAVLGDYYFAQPSFGNFRASGGVMVGSLGLLPFGSAAGGQRIGMSLSALPQYGSETPASSNTSPYLGLGFSGTPWHNRLSISADLGLMAERGSALFGNQGFEGTLRELRLSPVLQLGVSYAF